MESLFFRILFIPLIKESGYNSSIIRWASQICFLQPWKSKIQLSKFIELEIMGDPNDSSKKIIRYKGYNTVYNKIENDATFLKDLQEISSAIQIKYNPVNFVQQKELEDGKCEDIAKLAMLHRDASIANQFDLMEFYNLEDDRRKCQFLAKTNRCPCGCLQIKAQPLPVCLAESELQFLGSNTILFFFFTRIVIILCGIILVLNGVYSLVNSILGKSHNDCQYDISCIIRTHTSIQSKADKPDLIIKEMWLGMVICIFFCIVLRIAKLKAKLIDEMIDSNVETPSDHAIKLENMPRGDYCEEEVIDWIGSLVLKMNMKINEERDKIQCKEVHIVYNMEGARNLINDIEQQILKLKKMVKMKGLTIQSTPNLQLMKSKKIGKIYEDQEVYISEKTKLISYLQSLEDKKKMFFADSSYRRKLSSTCCIIQFNSSKSKQRFLNQYGVTKFGLLAQIRVWLYRKLNWAQKGERLFKGNLITIQRAPQPEDIKWENCQKKYSLSRVVLIWFVTSLTILVSFAIIVGLNYVQVFFVKKGASKEDSQVQVLNYVISFVLVIINAVLWTILPLLIKLEYNHTTSQQVISMTSKTVFAQSVNSIVLPIIINLALEDKLYGNDGLTAHVFDFAISNCLINVLLMFINPKHLIKNAALQITCLRNKLIRFLSKGDPGHNEYIHSVNKFYQGQQMNIVGSSVYLTGGMLFVTFNGFLQPLILFIMCISTICFYYIQKYLLLRRYTSPKMLDKSVFDNTLFLLSYTPMFYAGGCLFYTVYIFGINWDMILPCVITLGIAGFNMRNFSGVLDRVTEWFWAAFSKKSVTTRESTTGLSLRRRGSSACQSKLLSQIGRLPHNTKKMTYRQPKQQVAQHEDQDKFKRNMEYYQHNHISTLVGYDKELSGEMLAYDSVVRQQIKKFATKYTFQQISKFDYPEDSAINALSDVNETDTNKNSS